MTYIVGGTPRSGKSILQHILLNEYNIPGFSTDILREGFEYGVPDFGVKAKMSDHEKSEILWPFLKGILIARKNYTNDLLIEGTHFIPSFLADFKVRQDIRMCFLGYSNIDVQDKFKSIRSNSSPDDDWTSKESDESLISLIDEYKVRSIYFQQECKKYGIQYFDTGSNFTSKIREACKFLIV